MFENRQRILSEPTLEAMFFSAVEMLEQIGLETNRADLFDKVRKLQGFNCKGNRISISPDRIEAVLKAMRTANTPPTHPSHPIIAVSDRSTLFANHRTRQMQPLTRQQVIEGTKLLDSLADKWVHAKSCGTPQDVPEPLKAIEQYVIGFRYNRNGGSTSVPPSPETASAFWAIREIAEDLDFSRRDFSVWVPSPLKLEGNELDDLLANIDSVASFSVGSMPIMGLTGPVDPVGVYTLSLAETIGGAAVLFALFPEAKPFIYPHPEPMDPFSGLLAFGTPEWLRLSLIHQDVMEYLQLYRADVDILTSSCMPDALAQADKSGAITAAFYHGFEMICLFPLCGDEAWSHLQLLLDVEIVHEQWRAIRRESSAQRAQVAFATIQEVVQGNTIAGSSMDTLMHLSENYDQSSYPRVFSAGQFRTQPPRDVISAGEAKVEALLRQVDYLPDDYKWRKIWTIYQSVCKQIGAEPFHFD